MLCLVYEFKDRAGRCPVGDFYDELQSKERAKVDTRMRMLRQAGPGLFLNDWFPHLERGIYKFKTARGRGVRMVRIMACLGPADPDSEVTLLAPAFEIGGKLVPDYGVLLAEAIERMAVVTLDPKGRREVWTL